MNICWPLPIDPSEVAGRRDDLASAALQALRYEGGGTAVLLSQFLDDVLYVISIPLAEVVAGVCEVRVLPVIGVWALSLPVAQVRVQREVTAGQRQVTVGQREVTEGQRKVTAGQREVTAGQRGDSKAEGGHSRSEGGHSRSEGGHSRSEGGHSRSEGSQQGREGSQPADRSFTNFQVHRCAVGRAKIPARSSIPGVCSLLDICSFVN